MERLKKSVEALVAEEYGRAVDKFGPVNHTDHESSAIIREELDEAFDELGYVSNHNNRFWEMVKHDTDSISKQAELSSLMHAATAAACEMIQVAAMAYKAKLTIGVNNGEAIPDVEQKNKQ